MKRRRHWFLFQPMLGLVACWHCGVLPRDARKWCRAALSEEPE